MDNNQQPTNEPVPNPNINKVPAQPSDPTPIIQPQAQQNPLMSPETPIQPPVTPPITMPPPKKRSKAKIFLFTLGGLILIIGIIVGVMAWKGLFDIRASDNPNESIAAKISHMKLFNLKNVPDGWQQFDSDHIGVSFVAPDSWEVKESYGWSKLYIDKVAEKLKDSDDENQKSALESLQLGAIYSIKVNTNYADENEPFFNVSILNSPLSKHKAKWQDAEKQSKEDGQGESSNYKITDTKWHGKDAFEYSYSYDSTDTMYSKSIFVDFGDKTLEIMVSNKGSDYSKSDDYTKILDSLTINKYDLDYFISVYNDQSNIKVGKNIDTSGFKAPSSWDRHDYPENNFSFYTPSSWEVGGYTNTVSVDESKNISLSIYRNNKKEIPYFGQSDTADLQGTVDFTIASTAMSVATGNTGWLFEQYSLKWNGLDAMAVVAKTAQNSSETTYFIDAGDSIYTFPGPSSDKVTKDAIVNSPDYSDFVKSFHISE